MQNPIATDAEPPRPRLVYALLLTLTVIVGLASRHFSALLPPLLAKNAGDILYATMAFWLVGLLFPRLSTLRAATVALLFCIGIEFLKFAQTPWLVAARESRAGALVFGRGFHVSNLVCYALGVGLGVGIEWALRVTGKPPRPNPGATVHPAMEERLGAPDGEPEKT